MHSVLCILIIVHRSQEGSEQIEVISPVDPDGVVHFAADGHLLPAHRHPPARVPTCRIGCLLPSDNKSKRLWSQNSRTGHIVVDLPPYCLRFS